MTVFVDDLTFSGTHVNKLFRTRIEGIIKNAGLKVHPDKTMLYSREKPKLITGAIVDTKGMKLRNKHHKAIYTLFSQLDECENDEQLESLQKRLVGSLHAAGQIEPIFKQRAAQLMRNTLKTK